MNNQEFNKDINMNTTSNGLVVKPDVGLLFSGDPYGLFVFNKTERLVTAIYLLTGLMSDKEPMKERLRSLATEMLLTALSMSERVWGEDVFQKNLLSSIFEISTLFKIAESAKMISKMNHQIIDNELIKLSNFLVTSASNYSSAKIAIEPTLFDGDYNFVPDQRLQNLNQNNTAINNSNTNSEISKGQESIKDISNNNVPEKMSVKNSKTDKTEKKNLKDKNDRQEIIKSMLKGGQKLTIKDFAKNIKDCSEKTIQRELVDMVEKGQLKKEGERRWSKYFLS